MKSCLYIGKLRHRRRRPVPNDFTYPIYMTHLDLTELDEVFRGRWLWSIGRRTPVSFRRSDYLGNANVPLDQAVRDLVEERKGERPRGPIRLLTNLRHFGHIFNPVSFYFIHDAEDTRVETIVAEITNTPWGERHCEVLPASESTASHPHHHHEFNKSFHVSPFMPMDIAYRWNFTEPGEAVAVHMENWREGECIFDATLTMRRREITGPNLALTLARFPLMTLRVVAAIHWQALRLWWKRVPFHTHPKKLGPKTEVPRS